MNKSETVLNGAAGRNFTFDTDMFGTRDDRTVLNVSQLELLTQLAGVSHIRFTHGNSGLFSKPFYNFSLKDEPTHGSPRKWRRAEVVMNSHLINQLSESALQPGKNYSGNINHVLRGSLRDISKQVNFNSYTPHQVALDIASILSAYIMGNIASSVTESNDPVFLHTLKYRLILSVFFNMANFLNKYQEAWGTGIPYQLLSSIRPERHLLLSTLLVKPLTRPKEVGTDQS